MKKVLLVLVFIVVGAVSFGARTFLDPSHEREMLMDMAYLPDKKPLQWMGGGMDDLLADMLWLRSLRYVVDHIASDRDYRYLFKVYDIITDLDPNFIRAYRYGGYFLSGLSHDKRDYEQATTILAKGWKNTKEDPEAWHIAYELATVYNVSLKDPTKAGEWFERAAKHPLCPAIIREHATVLYQDEGRLKRAWQMWVSIREKAESESLKKVSDWNVRRMESLILIMELKAVVERYREEKGSLPKTLQDLCGAGLIGAVPKDGFEEDLIYIITRKEDGAEQFYIDSKELIRKAMDRRIGYMTRSSLGFKHKHGRPARSVKELLGAEWVGLMPHDIQPDYDPETGEFSYDRSLKSLSQ